jgi:hypothetical protein
MQPAYEIYRLPTFESLRMDIHRMANLLLSATLIRGSALSREKFVCKLCHSFS